jgi:hypothetical protein
VWAELLKRVFGVDALRCPGCGGRLRLIAAITEPEVARWILECLSLQSRAPPLALAEAVDRETESGGDSFESGSTDADGDPGFEFDQSFEDDSS